MRLNHLLNPLTWLISPLALLAVWAWVAHLGLFPRNLLVPPAQVLQTFADLLASGELQEHGWALALLSARCVAWALAC